MVLAAPPFCTAYGYGDTGKMNDGRLLGESGVHVKHMDEMSIELISKYEVTLSMGEQRKTHVEGHQRKAL